MIDDGCIIKQLLPDEWETYRFIRLTALQNEPGYFCASFAEENRFDEAEWRARVYAPRRCAHFGLFDADRIIGLTGILLDRDDPSDRTALLIASYIDPAWRRRGLSELLYRARLDWAREHPTVRKIIVAHRADNEASRRANQRHGFVFTHREPCRWQDGATYDKVCYELVLKK